MTDYAPETGPDGRPRPKFGEYATPEEQRARIRQPDATFDLDAGVAPQQPAPAAPSQRYRPGGAPGPAGAPAAPTGDAVRPPSRVADRIATIALLAYGAVNVFASVPAYLDLTSYLPKVMAMFGIDAQLTNVDAAQVWGPVAAIALIVGYVVTAILALRNLRRGRLAWWIPVVGAVVTYLVASICLTVVLVGDPGFTQSLTSLR